MFLRQLDCEEPSLFEDNQTNQQKLETKIGRVPREIKYFLRRREERLREVEAHESVSEFQL